MIIMIRNAKIKFTISHIEKRITEFNDLQKKLNVLLQKEAIARVGAAGLQNQIKDIENEFDAYLSELASSVPVSNQHFAKWMPIINSHISDRKIKERKVVKP